MRLLILVASLAYASGGVLEGDITGDLRPPPQARQETSGYATTAGIGASASDATGGGGGWVGIQQQQQQLLQQQQLDQQSDLNNQGLLASYQPSVLQAQAQTQVAQVPQYENAAPAPEANSVNYQEPQQPSATGVSGTGHKYTTVTFGNGLVGLGPTVDYNAIGQSQNQGQNNYVHQVQEASSAAIQDTHAGHAFGIISSGPVETGTSLGHAYDTISVSQHIQTVPIEVPHEYQVVHSRPVAVPTPVEIPRPVPIEVPQPAHVHVERPYPVTVEQHVPQPVYVKVPHPVKVPQPHYHHKPSYPTFQHTDIKHIQLGEHHFPASNFHQEHFQPQTTAHHHEYQDFNLHLKDHFKLPLSFGAEHHPHHHHHHHEHHDAVHHHGSNHHSTSILAGLTGGLSTKLRGGHGGGVPHHHGGGHGAAGGFRGDHKFTDGLQLGHLAYHTDDGYQFGHGFSGSLNFGGSGVGGGYANGYSGKYLGGSGSLPTFSYEKYPSKYPSHTSTKYSSSFPSYHGASSSSSSAFASSYKVPETINQQYDSHGGYKY